MEEKPFELKLTKKILDNVHGFIPYTEEEGQIINLPLFRRLQGIKQLSLIDHVFPGAEHTRFIHSIGVMHIADKMAISLGFNDRDRRIIRLAGLLHDIGHYPLSHVCEHAYKDFQVKVGDFSIQDYDGVLDAINKVVKIKTDYMKLSTGAHHEAVSAKIVYNSEQIKRIINDSKAINQICAMITGDGRSEGIDKVMVQILHSEIDADGIDYMLRDALFSGTSFGHFEIDMLINHLKVKEFRGERIICIEAKGIPAADQYLINKYFSYSQVTFNKHVAIYEWMASTIVAWLQQANAYFPKDSTLLNEWISEKEISDEYLHFDDSFFWKALRDMTDNPLACFAKKDIVSFCKRLLSHQDLEMVRDSELRFDSDDSEKARDKLSEWFAIKGKSSEQSVTLFSSIGFTKHVPAGIFEKELEKEAKRKKENDQDDPNYNEFEADKEIEQEQQQKRILRLMDGAAVEHLDGSIGLLCDDERSLMHYFYKVKLYILRQYNLNSQ